jgi:hypothetical protein
VVVVVDVTEVMVVVVVGTVVAMVAEETTALVAVAVRATSGESLRMVPEWTRREDREQRRWTMFCWWSLEVEVEAAPRTTAAATVVLVVGARRRMALRLL